MTRIILEIPDHQSVALRFEEELSPSDFDNFCALHPDLRVEREPDGQITIMSPVHYASSNHEAEFIADLMIYARTVMPGRVCSSAAGFTLPDGSVRMPDAAFLTAEQDESLSAEDRSSFAAIVPIFVVEVRSDSDRLSTLKKKMRDTWIANGVHLAWLVDPQTLTTTIYRRDGSETEISGFDQILDGEDVLPGFRFDLSILAV